MDVMDLKFYGLMFALLCIIDFCGKLITCLNKNTLAYFESNNTVGQEVHCIFIKLEG